jgi:hypothetical protein
MANKQRMLTAGAALAATLLSATLAGAAQRQPVTVVLHITDHAQVSARILARAERIVEGIYDRIGVRVVFIENGAVQTQVFDQALHLRVRLLSREMADRKIQASRADDTVLGRAARETGYAYILTPRVIDCANRLAIDRAELLGLVIAHEVGHLVMPVHSHSTIGIMRADLDLSATLPGFTPQQGETIRALVATDIQARQ